MVGTYINEAFHSLYSTFCLFGRGHCGFRITLVGRQNPCGESQKGIHRVGQLGAECAAGLVQGHVLSEGGEGGNRRVMASV